MKLHQILLISFLLISNIAGQVMKIPEPIPTPKKFIQNPGRFVFNKNTSFYFDYFTFKSDFFKLNLENEIQEKFGLSINLPITSTKPQKNYIHVSLMGESEFYNQFNSIIDEFKLTEKQEGYLLVVEDSRILILANNTHGAFYGLMSLLQMLQLNEKKNVFVQNCIIADFPSYPMRGISDDIARGQVSTLDDFKRIIRLLARYKMNVYQPYFEDAIEIKSFPDIGLNRGRLTQSEIKELVAYAQEYFVEIIPIFQTLGHWENLLVQPNYYYLAEFPGAASLDVTNPKTYEFLEKCLAELTQLFPSKYFHAGLDESWDVGFGNSKALTDSIGIARVHANHYKKVNDILKKYDKVMMMYGDIIHNHPEIFEMLPKDIIVVDWRYGVNDYEPYVKKFADYKQPFICSPSVTNYNRIFPHIVNSILNIKNFAEVAYKYGAIGFINSNWGDNGGENFREFNWYGYAFGAECAWNPTNVDVDNFNSKFFLDFYGTDDKRLNVIYNLLSDFGAMFSQYDFWRNPFVRFKNIINYQPQNIVLFAETVKSKGLLAKTLIQDVKKVVKLNATHLDYLSFVAEQGIWYADKLNYAHTIKNLIDKKGGYLTRDERNRVTQICEDMIERLNNMKATYRQLWLRTNRSDNLQLIEKEKYDRQINSWQIMKDATRDEIVEYDQTIKSPWIYHPDANPNQKNATQEPVVIFERDLIVKDKITSALIHLMADSYAEVFVNQHYVGDVRGKKTLSLWVESLRAKFFDITDYLNVGNNKIRIIVRNYGENASAGINFQLDVKTPISHHRIYSDNTFKVSNDGIDFKEPKLISDIYLSSEPDFARRITSWYER